METFSKLLLTVTVITTADGNGIPSRLAAPTNLRLREKTETSMHLEWDPTEILLPSYQDLVTHYLVTYAPFDPISVTSGIPQQVHVPRPGLKVWLRGLEPETVYNITVQAGTKQGYGEILWGAYSTLPPGQPHVLKLKHRTPTSLHVYWTTVWGTPLTWYKLAAEPLYSVDPFADLNRILAFEVAGSATEYVIKGLHPQTIYNVTLKPMTADTVAWGFYATLPPGAFVVTNLTVCNETPYSMAFSWKPIDDVNPVHYQVRYAKQSSSSWNELTQRSKHELRCPGDPCDVLCFALYNLEGGPQQYIVQVRAFVEGSWNRWKTVARLVSDDSPLPMSYPYKRTCCIVPPPYFVKNLDEGRTQMLVKIKPVRNATFVQRYYVIVDEREPHGEVNETTLYDKVTAKRLGVPYYITASFDKYRLTEERMFPIGDGNIYGGYINYPLQKGKNITGRFLQSGWSKDGHETGCVTSDVNSLRVCKENLCNRSGTTTFELQHPHVDIEAVAIKVLKWLDREMQEKPFYPPNENTNNLSLPARVGLKLLLVLFFMFLFCIVCIIICCCVCGCAAVCRKFMKKRSASGSKPDITSTSLLQLNA